MLTVEGLRSRYGRIEVLHGVDLKVDSGEIVTVVGANGAGKTTLLRCLTGLLPLSQGQIRLDDADITTWPSHRRSHAGIAYVPQGREIFSDLTVGENLRIAAKAHGIRDRTVEEEITTMFPVLGEMWRRRGGDLSGGQQQQLAIGRALMGRPSLLILDEPTEGIQPNIVKLIETVIAGLKGRMTILLVEQYYDFAATLADTYVVLERGAIVASGEGSAMDRDNVSRFLSI